MDLDSAKENIMPLAGGRNARYLETALSAESHHEVVVELQNQRRHYEEEIQKYVGEDPLMPWFEYILWIEQSYPSGGKENGLIEVLLKCLTAFENHPQYVQDRRMIKLYIKYIDTQPNPLEYYQELFNQGIGTMVADLYICWAYYYDLSGNFQKADEIFRKGLDARAEPFDELDHAHKHFGFTMSQRILYKDEESSSQFMSSMLERRHALTSLRSHRKKVGSIRTGAAVRSFNPGKVQIDKTKPGPSSNIALTVFEDENHDPNAVSAQSITNSEVPKPPQSVIRSIIDSSRKQENMKEPGPWSKVRLHDKRKGSLFGSSRSSGTHGLGFEIMEDNSEESEPALTLAIQLPPNFVSTNQPQTPWIVPLTIEAEVAANVYPCYEKFSLYPKSDVYSPEELAAYKWFKKRSIDNEFTKQHDCVWGGDFNYGFHLYPNFASRNIPQTEFIVERFIQDEELDSNHQFAFKVKEVYPEDSTEEYQFEEILSRKLKEGTRKLKINKNETIIMQEEMDETQCAVETTGRKSIFPSRKSLAVNALRRIQPIPEEFARPIPKVEAVDQAIPEEVAHARRSVIMPNPQESPPTIGVSPRNEQKPTQEQIVEEIVVIKDEGVVLPEKVTPPPSASDGDKFVIYEDLSDDIGTFKTPNLPANLKPNSAFEQEEEPNVAFGANETCSTQTFNFFIKSQSVSTPKNIRKIQSHTTQMQEVVPNVISPELVPNVISPELCTTGTNTMCPPKQLSVIMETTEANTVSSGTKSSGDTHMSSHDFDTESLKYHQATKVLNFEQLSPLNPIAEVSTVQKNIDVSNVTEQKEAGIPSLMMSMKLFEEKTENLPKSLLKSIPKEQSNDDKFGDLFTTTPEKCPPIKSMKTASFAINDSMTFSKMKDFTMPKLSELTQPNLEQFGMSQDQSTRMNRSILPGFESFEVPPKLNASLNAKHEFDHFQLGFEFKEPKSPEYNIPLERYKTVPSGGISFEDNIRTDAFVPNISSLKSSTLLMPPFPQISYIQEPSFHIKEEPGASCNAASSNTDYSDSKVNHRKSILSRFSEISCRQSKVDSFNLNVNCSLSNDDDLQAASIKSQSLSKPSVVDHEIVFHSELMPKPISVKQENFQCENNEISDNVDLGQSIYDHPAPKTPQFQRHIWLDDDLGRSDENQFIHPEVDMNLTRQVLENLIDQNVNPFDQNLIKALLDQIDFCSYIENLPTCSMVNRIRPLQKGSKVKVGVKNFDVVKLAGEGSYGTVFCAKDHSDDKTYALKQEKPANLWEYYICLELKSRINNSNILPGFMDIEYAVIGNNASILISNYSKYGSLINVCHKVNAVTGKNLDEFIVMVLSSQMLYIIDHLHASNIIHADVKPDNFLLMSKMSYGSSTVAVQLIDFGVAIDLDMFPPKQKFTYMSRTENFACIEMREKRPWTFQTDLFGLAATIHVLLFAKYMSVVKRPIGWTIQHQVPRYFNRSLWNTIFSTLLNIRDCNSMPNLQRLRELLEQEIAENERFVREKINEFNLAVDQ